MGTSLSGLTPATTFDGLLKVGDNDPLTANLKAISDGSGNDSAIQLSTGELKVIGQFNLDSDTAETTINLRGDGLSINQIYQANNVTYNSIVLLNSSGIRLNNGTGTALLARGGNVGIGGITATPSARLQVKGSGTTSATTSLLVQNSAGGNVFSITDDGFFTFNDPGGSDALTIENGNNNSKIRYNDNLWLGSSHGTYVPTLKIDRTAGLSVETTGGSLLNLLYDTGNLGIGETTPTARLHVKGSGNDNTTTSLLVQNSAGTDLLKVTDDGFVNTNQTLIVNHPTNSLRSLRLGWGSLYATDSNSELSIGAVYSQNTAPTIVLGGKTRTGGADAVLVQALNGMYLSTTVRTEDPSAQLHVKAGTTQDVIARFQDPLNASSYIDIKNDSTLTDYTGIYWGNRAKIRSKQTGTIFIDTSVGVVFADGNASKTKIYPQGQISIGTSTIPASTMAYIKGSGTTSATTALLVENSAGDDLFKVEDGGLINIGGANGYTIQSNTLSPKINGYLALDRNSNRTFSIGDSNASRTYLKVQSSLTSNFADVSINTDHLFVKKEGNVAIGTSTIDASAKLQVDSTTQGFLPPRMTDAERDAIATPAAGLMIYDTTNNQMNYWNGSTWIAF